MVLARDYMAREATKIINDYKQGKISKRQARDFLYCTGYTAKEALQELQFADKQRKRV